MERTQMVNVEGYQRRSYVTLSKFSHCNNIKVSFKRFSHCNNIIVCFKRFSCKSYMTIFLL